MVVVVQCPIIVHVYNVGDILLSGNISVSPRINDIDVHHHFICYYIEYRTVKINFFFSEENLADPFKKKISNGTFLRTIFGGHCGNCGSTG